MVNYALVSRAIVVGRYTLCQANFFLLKILRVSSKYTFLLPVNAAYIAFLSGSWGTWRATRKKAGLKLQRALSITNGVDLAPKSDTQ
jgi:hypothetical protein